MENYHAEELLLCAVTGSSFEVLVGIHEGSTTFNQSVFN
ncbi:dTDP-4-dehydrorhamnose 3,5-epimerase-like enzyme [Sporolactobacillus spathodeae]|uniref:dTDP-4-dehydrorhamnose 3,5-epimerase-like enzyme n=1 Tax=Sporolactobacillus spathodeae TaxID=1465502 RepID=A0ABS2Q7J0_9BACL|nr:dTDP-4-dehydrorhamnose 3,5-epimerase-like enzyme [Sporolactobacillus spathodeae]